VAKKSKHSERYLLANLEYLYKQSKLWLNPAYQREAVWTLSQKQLLIDSLLVEIDVPKLYIREIDKDNYEFEVVDGQQRLRAVFEFFNDEFKMPRDADDVDGHVVKDRFYSDLATDLQMKLQNTPLDIVVLNSAYSDDDIEETFLRLQNGTPLNAAEKRRAIAGNMREVVEGLAQHQAFSLCSFENRRFAYEDVVAKVLHLLLAGRITDIKPISIARTYEQNRYITADDPVVKKANRALRFIVQSFKGSPSPGFKKYAMITLPYLTMELLEKYNLSQFPEQFAESYRWFEVRRAENRELPEERQDPGLAAYTDAARSDSIQAMLYRHELLRETVIRRIPELTLKDPTRGFSEEQRTAIFMRDDGRCRSCGKECDENEFHADHIVPHASGGPTRIANGQVLCPVCNLRKGSRTQVTVS
jgi:hypothetical protein